MIKKRTGHAKPTFPRDGELSSASWRHPPGAHHVSGGVIVINVIDVIIIVIATGGAKPAPAECDEGARGEKCAHSKQVLYMMMTMMMLMVVVVVLTPSRCCT